MPPPCFRAMGTTDFDGLSREELVAILLRQAQEMASEEGGWRAPPRAIGRILSIPGGRHTGDLRAAREVADHGSRLRFRPSRW